MSAFNVRILAPQGQENLFGGLPLTAIHKIDTAHITDISFIYENGSRKSVTGTAFGTEIYPNNMMGHVAKTNIAPGFTEILISVREEPLYV